MGERQPWLWSGSAEGGSSSGGEGGCGGDYLVPWHIPFHRVQAAAASAAQGMDRGSKGNIHPPGMQAASCGYCGKDNHANGVFDAVKNTVMFKRYYHLFDEGELDNLVSKTQGVRPKTSYYDKSNWCAVLERL